MYQRVPSFLSSQPWQSQPSRGGGAVCSQPRALGAVPPVTATTSASPENLSLDGKIPKTHSPLGLDGEGKPDKDSQKCSVFYQGNSFSGHLRNPIGSITPVTHHMKTEGKKAPAEEHSPWFIIKTTKMGADKNRPSGV